MLSQKQQENLRKLIEANAKRRLDKVWMQKWREAQKGKGLGRKQDPEWIRKRTAGMKGRVFSLESRLKMSASHKGKQVGKENPAWKHGQAKRLWGKNPLRKTMEMRLWRESVLARDKKCVLCESLDDLQTDHIKPLRDFPELAFSLENGRVLCGCCHRKQCTSGSPKRRIDKGEK